MNKYRTFSLNLSDDAVKKLYNLAVVNGITPANILEGFIIDLLNDDPEEPAKKYFNYCAYGSGLEKEFPAWLIEYGLIETAVDALQIVDNSTDDIEFLNMHPEMMDLGDLETLEKLRKGYTLVLSDKYDEYTENGGKQNFSDAVISLRQYYAKLQEILAEQPETASYEGK